MYHEKTKTNLINREVNVAINKPSLRKIMYKEVAPKLFYKDIPQNTLKYFRKYIKMHQKIFQKDTLENTLAQI